MKAVAALMQPEDRTGQKDFDRIWRFLFLPNSRIELTEHESKVHERWDFAWRMLIAMYTRKQLVNAIIKKYGVSKRCAYDDVKFSMMLFGDGKEQNKAAKKLIAEEWIVRGIKKAWDEEDMDAYDKLISRYTKLNGLDEEHAENPLKDLKPNTIVIVSNMEQLQQEAEALQREITVDVPHEDA